MNAPAVEGLPASGLWLDRFLPGYLREYLARRVAPVDDYCRWDLDGALLFVDMVGFTAQVEHLAAAGPDGPDRANELVDHSIGRLVEALDRAGGDVVVFAGDALFVLWPRLRMETGLEGAVARAAQAALEALASRAQSVAPGALLRFSMGAGAFTAHHVGGHGGRWHCLLSGAAFEQVGRADALALNDTLVASPEAVSAAAGRIDVTRTGHGMLIVYHSRPPQPVVTEVAESALARERVLPFLSAPVLHNLDRLGSRWLADLRRPTVIFARLGGLLRKDGLDGPLAHRATRLIQEITERFDGATLQFVIDDKGPVLIVVFGLAAKVHEDDPARAALAALRMVEALTRQGITCGLGVATGRAFCGLIGTDARASYTLIGRTMNLAARLMQTAAPGPLVDQGTFELSAGQVDYAPAGALHFKGLGAGSPHYQVLGARPVQGAAEASDTDPLLGRAPELRVLQDALDRLQRERCGGLVALVGEAGIGKSRLVRAVLRCAGKAQILTQVVVTGAINAGLLSSWRPLLQRLIAARDAGTARFEDQFFLHALIGDPSGTAPEADDAERAFRTREAITTLILEAASRQPLLLCVEDAHWMDSLSWSLVAWLAQRAAASSAPLLIVLTSRELETHAPPEALARLRQAGMIRLPLQPLSDADGVGVACSVLQVDRLPEPLGHWISSRSGGNPLFCRELAVAALESGRIRIVDSRIDLDPERWGPLRDVHPPYTLQGLIASRLDRLDTAGQLVLRMAAVIGNQFTLEALQALVPEEVGDLLQALQRVHAAGFLERAAVDANVVFRFGHALVRDAAYDSLPYRSRRELHARMGRWLAAQPAAVPASLLAYHWERAEILDAAFAAHVTAGKVALQNYSNREAVAHFSVAVRIRTGAPEACARLQVENPDLGLARALHRMGDGRGSRRHLESALRAAGEVLPRNAGARIATIVLELGWGILPTWLRRRRRRLEPGLLRARVAAYDELPEILYYDNDPLALAHATLRFLHLAEAEARPTAEYARALAWSAMLGSSIGGLAAAERSFDASLRVGDEAGDPALAAWLRLARGSTLAQYGQWTQAERWLHDARGRCAALGDRTRWWNITSGLAHVLSYRGELQAAADLLSEAIEVNRDTDNPLFMCWGLSGHADILHRLGQGGEACTGMLELRRARQALGERPDAAADLFSRGVMAAALYRAGLGAEAWELTRQTVDQALHAAPMVWLQVSSYLGLEYVLRESARDPARRDEALLLMQALERSLRRFARLIPIALPTLALLRGGIAQLRGRRSHAVAIYLSGLQVAHRLSLGLEAGKLHLALAEMADLGDARSHLDRAVELFSRIGANHHAAVAQQRRSGSDAG